MKVFLLQASVIKLMMISQKAALSHISLGECFSNIGQGRYLLIMTKGGGDGLFTQEWALKTDLEQSAYAKVGLHGIIVGLSKFIACA